LRNLSNDFNVGTMVMGNCDSDPLCPQVHEFATNRLRIRGSLNLVKGDGESDIIVSGKFGCVYAFNEIVLLGGRCTG
jgi:hypothetical protein